MVDLHSHIFPGVDDGAKSINESLKMLRRAAAAGVDTIVATPHLLLGVYKTELQERKSLTVELQKAADENGIQIQVKAGVEYYLSPEILEDSGKLKDLTIDNNGKYILVELPMQVFPPYAEDVLFKIKMLGVTPLLAHPERNMAICNNPNILFDLIVTKGIVAQLNAGSLLGYFGKQSKRTARLLVTHNLVHVVGSDMHSPSSVTMPQAMPEIKMLIGSERASRLFNENPRQILLGEEFSREMPVRLEQKRKGFLKSLFG